ncbi:MAG: hypothetical protein E7354_00495 [Clostridiales bacterium]|nr:hypothetical protein [Clostridiales bacterium]
MKFFLFILIFGVGFLCGCSRGFEERLLCSVSEIQNHVFVGDCQDINAILIVGEREIEYKKDGFSTDKIPFAVLSFSSVEKERLVPTKYSLVVGNDRYSGTLVSNPYDGSWVVDVGKVGIADIMVASIWFENRYIDVVLSSITENLEVQSSDVIDILLTQNEVDLKKLNTRQGFCGEIYIKLLGDLKKDSFNLCWCLTIVGREGDRCNYVFSANTGEMVFMQGL